MADSETSTAAHAGALATALRSVGDVVRGNPEAVKLLFATVLARGHVLLEDVPGVGKTTLARAAAQALGCSFSRIQFTSDLLPSDVIGVQVLDPRTGTLRFQRGPLFANLVLADEINRASPKTQSALLEAMADRQVSVDDVTHPLLPPFSVLATQNPVEHHGAYPLPESQLDRFTVCLSLGYPARDDEKALLIGNRTADVVLATLGASLDVERVIELQQHASRVTLSDSVASYLLAMVESSRVHPDVELGCSPRGSLAWAALVRALAVLEGRSFVLPDDVKRTARAVLVHRLSVRGAGDGAGARVKARAIVDEIVSRTPAPR